MAKDRFGCPNKQKSRETLWKTLSRNLHPPLARILIFPGSDRYELDTVLKLGFRPENIYLVEKNPAVKATFTRRASKGVLPPPENFLRMLASDAAKVLKKRGVTLDASHLDFCSHCESGEMFSETQKFFKTGIVKNNGLVALTVLAGREQDFDAIKGNAHSFGVKGGQAERFKQFGKSDQGRLYRIWKAVGMELHAVDFGRYHNTHTNSPMLWSVFKVNKLNEHIQKS